MYIAGDICSERTPIKYYCLPMAASINAAKLRKFFRQKILSDTAVNGSGGRQCEYVSATSNFPGIVTSL
jgi:hypothetical protein